MVFLQVWLSLGLQWLYRDYHCFPSRLDKNVKLVKLTQKSYYYHYYNIINIPSLGDGRNLIGHVLLYIFRIFFAKTTLIMLNLVWKSAISGSKFCPVCELCSFIILPQILHGWQENTFCGDGLPFLPDFRHLWEKSDKIWKRDRRMKQEIAIFRLTILKKPLLFSI